MTRSSRRKAQTDYAALADLCSDEDDFCNVSKRNSSRNAAKERSGRGSPVAKRPRLSPEDKFECDMKVALQPSQDGGQGQQQQQPQLDCTDQPLGGEGNVLQEQKQRESSKAAAVKKANVLSEEDDNDDSEDKDSDDDASFESYHSDSDASISSDGVNEEDDDSEDDYENELSKTSKAKGGKTTGKGKGATASKQAAPKKIQPTKKEKAAPKTSIAKKASSTVAPVQSKPTTTTTTSSSRSKQTTKQPAMTPDTKLSCPAGLGGPKLSSRAAVVKLEGVKLPTASTPRGGSVAGVKVETPSARKSASSRLVSPGGLGGVKLTSPAAGVGGGIRVGLSRNARVKPLHQLPACKN